LEFLSIYSRIFPRFSGISHAFFAFSALSSKCGNFWIIFRIFLEFFWFSGTIKYFWQPWENSILTTVGNFHKWFLRNSEFLTFLTPHQSINNRGKIPFLATKVVPVNFGPFKNLTSVGKFHHDNRGYFHFWSQKWFLKFSEFLKFDKHGKSRTF